MFKKLFRTFAVFLFLSGSFVGKAISNELTFFTIGTGGTAYTYYPVGGMIANAISKPPGSRECGKGGSCGVDGLLASAVSSSDLTKIHRIEGTLSLNGTNFKWGKSILKLAPGSATATFPSNGIIFLLKAIAIIALEV